MFYSIGNWENCFMFTSLRIQEWILFLRAYCVSSNGIFHFDRYLPYVIVFLNKYVMIASLYNIDTFRDMFECKKVSTKFYLIFDVPNVLFRKLYNFIRIATCPHKLIRSFDRSTTPYLSWDLNANMSTVHCSDRVYSSNVVVFFACDGRFYTWNMMVIIWW